MKRSAFLFAFGTLVASVSATCWVTNSSFTVCQRAGQSYPINNPLCPLIITDPICPFITADSPAGAAGFDTPGAVTNSTCTISIGVADPFGGCSYSNYSYSSPCRSSTGKACTAPTTGGGGCGNP